MCRDGRERPARNLPSLGGTRAHGRRRGRGATPLDDVAATTAWRSQRSPQLGLMPARAHGVRTPVQTLRTSCGSVQHAWHTGAGGPTAGAIGVAPTVAPKLIGWSCGGSRHQAPLQAPFHEVPPAPPQRERPVAASGALVGPHWQTHCTSSCSRGT